MPRLARLDMPGLLQHVIVRGIEKRKIFRDDQDRAKFLVRLEDLLKETGSRCYAWSLLSNHFHLLLKPIQFPLALLMRRLLTGYAVNFNLRHRRCGHLFQNRYKSIVCEEEPYLLELVRYIHLNPIRAGLVADLEELDKYPWSGHSVLMGKQQMDGQEVAEVLHYFAETPGGGRQKYREFIADGLGVGRREDLVGGGFRRSDRGKREFRNIGNCDIRVLGSGEFVDRLQQKEELRERLAIPLPLTKLVDQVSFVLDVSSEAMRWPSKARPLAEARALVCYLALREFGYKGVEVGRELHLGPAGVSLAARRGAAFLRDNPEVKKKMGVCT